MTVPALTWDRVRLTRPGGFVLDAAFSIAPGERVALMGASGSGKSTLLDLAAGFETPDSGRILFAGRDMTAAPPAERPASILFQQDNLFGHLDAFSNVALALSPGLRLTEAQREAVGAALASVGLAGKERRLPSALSGGERQRVAIARTVLRDRPVLLLDEPFASLGPALAREMLDLVAADAPSAAIVLVTHDPHEALAFASRVVFLADGRVEADGAARSILVDAPPAAVRAYLDR